VLLTLFPLRRLSLLLALAARLLVAVGAVLLLPVAGILLWLPAPAFLLPLPAVVTVTSAAIIAFAGFAATELPRTSAISFTPGLPASPVIPAAARSVLTAPVILSLLPAAGFAVAIPSSTLRVAGFSPIIAKGVD
jgi:hypothetical protein